MSDPIEDYIREFVGTFRKVKSIVVSPDGMPAMDDTAVYLEITKSIIGPFVYWQERHDTDYMEAADPELAPASELPSERASGTRSTPPEQSTIQSPVTLSVAVSGRGTYANRFELKAYGLRWDTSSTQKAWTGELTREKADELERFCKEKGLKISRVLI